MNDTGKTQWQIAPCLGSHRWVLQNRGPGCTVWTPVTHAATIKAAKALFRHINRKPIKLP